MGGTVCTMLLGILLISGCSTALQNQNASRSFTDRLQLNVGDGQNKIVFLTYEVTLADSVNDVYAFRLLHSSVVDGNLKNAITAANLPYDPAYLYVHFDDNDGQEHYLKLHDPLKMQLEYPGENNNVGKQTFINKKGEITIRFAYATRLKTISIFKVQPTTLKLKKVYHATL